ncbi:MAG TPA: DNA repair protein RecN [Casimicrobiaceae bacterium]|nr:DNA repair protein RecN [Casimicrobiaceae bacterium]
MLRLLSIRNFVVVESLDLELSPGFTVLTGETGAGKSILLDALGLLLGDRFELRQLRPGAERAELAAEFDIADAPGVRGWLADAELGEDDALLLRRVLDAGGRSRAWINGRPATLAQLAELGERLVALHGQHAHQSLAAADAQRALVDGFGGFTALTRDVADAWRAWRAAVERRDAAAGAAAAMAAERETLEEQARELAALGVSDDEWQALNATQSRLAHAAALIETAEAGEAALYDDDDALARRLAQLVQRIQAAAAHDPALGDIAALLEPASIQLEEAARALRDYRRRLDVDPAELSRVEQRLTTLHDAARKHRVRPDGLGALLAQTHERLAALAESADAQALERRAVESEAAYRRVANDLAGKRRFAASELAHRVTDAMQELAMAGGRLDILCTPHEPPASFGLEDIAFAVATHPKQPAGPLSRVASGGELSRIALAIAVVTSEVASVPTLVFDEVDTGIGGAVAATVGRLLQSLGARRQVLCVTHLPQVAAHADQHYRVAKMGKGSHVTSEVVALTRAARVDELARMLSGAEVTAKTRAHAKELFEQHQRTGQS